MILIDGLNDKQKEAVLHTEGPLLILAGAGSGKTRVLTHRIAYMIQENGVDPWNILAITFTNKAAAEMRERVENILEANNMQKGVWVATFHSTCIRILRRYIDRLGYSTDFTIYDTDDQKTLIKNVCKKLDIDTKIHKERALLSQISSAKDELKSPIQYALDAEGNFNRSRVAKVYTEYQHQLKNNNALDFDDIIVKTVELFQNNPDVLEYYQDKFKYIMVDEYQDTNTAQFNLINILASKYRNLCVVGDDDQSIYKFRGANIANILYFENSYNDATVIKLEQNYRSTKNILDAANGVIRNNDGRKVKSLWTENEEGDKIKFGCYFDAYDEADAVAREIADYVSKGGSYNNCACLYRTNAQSRILEEKFINRNIPYKIVGGQNFYQRKEIKDILAYLKTVESGRDDIAVRRIINVPKRAIGITTVNKVQVFADENDMGFFDALIQVQEKSALGKAGEKISKFVDMIKIIRAKSDFISLTELTEEILDRTGYLKELQDEKTEESQGRIENIDELISKIKTYEENTDEPTLTGFLEEVALVADIDNLNMENDYVVLLTMHSAKGLEFEKVIICGMEDGLFPGQISINSDDDSELEEERRLCYVAMTRAKENLTMTYAKQRMNRGEMHFNNISRFVREIPQSVMNEKEVNEINERSKSAIVKPSQTSNAKAVFNTKAFTSQTAKAAKADTLEYVVGDTVKHLKFGTGNVLEIIDGGKDFEVTVEFDKAGVKKMFASFAKLKKV